MSKGDEQDKKQIEENKKNPTGNLGESINRSIGGDLGALSQGGCLTKIITVFIIIGGILILSRCTK